MSKCKQPGAVIPRTVGDPVDVVTGASSDVTRDFTLAGPLPLVWRRYYDSGQNAYPGALGWGHTHEYDRWLAFDADGIRYVSPVNEVVGFPPVRHDGEEFATDGVVLRRLSLHHYHVEERGQPSLEFRFDQSLTRALLQRVFRAQHSIVFRYAPAGQLEEITDSLGRRIRVRMERGRVLALDLLDPAKNQHRSLLACQYDSAGNLVECKDPYGHVSRFRYDRSNRMITATDRRGFTFLYEYDAAGRCVRSRGEDGVLDVQLRYHPQARYTIVTQADGGEWTYFYNEAAALTQIIDPYGGVVKYQFVEGRTAAEVDPNGNITSFVYDPAGGLVGKAPAAPWGIDRSAALAAQGFVSCPLVWMCGTLVLPGLITLPAANDPALAPLPEAVLPWVQTLPGTGGRKGASIMQRGSPILSISLRKNDSLMHIRQRVARISRDPLFDGRVHDEFGTLVKEIGPYGHERLWSHDAVGNVLRYHDYDGCRTTFAYTSWNHCTQAVNALGHALTVQYTAGEQVASVRDAGGGRSEYAYDRKNRIVEVRRHGVVRERYRYDAADNFVEKRTGAGRRLFQVEIRPGNRCKAKHFGNGASHTFHYDEQGRLIGAAADRQKLAFAYDELGQLAADERDGLGVRHRYHGVELAATTVLGKFTTRYRHAPGGDWVIQDPTGKTHRVAALPHGLIVRTLANQTTEAAQFDRRGQCVLQFVTHPWAMPKPWCRAYYYSGEGDLVSVKDSATGALRYGYDEAHRLIQATMPSRDASVVTTEHRYAYDGAGNLLEQPGLKGVVLQEGNRLAGANGDHFDYDERNHIAARRGALTTIRYHYDDADLLCECELPTGRFRARYDPFARRIRKEFNDVWTEFYWDGDRLAAEVRHDGRVRVYIYAQPGALAPMVFVDYDSLQAAPESGRCFVLLTNQIGTPVLVQDDQGAAVWQARHMPYGLTRVSSTATVEVNLRMPGHYFDRETGLHCNRYRYYSPELGRYLQADPTGLAGGWNLYAYPASPLAFVDLDGLNCSDDNNRPGRPTDRETLQEPQWAPVRRKIEAPGLVKQLLDSKKFRIHGSPDYVDKVKKALVTIAGTKAGEKVLKKLNAGPHSFLIQDLAWHPRFQDLYGNHFDPDDSAGAGTPGVGSGGKIRWDADSPRPAESPAICALNHELGHAANASHGQMNTLDYDDPGMKARWSNPEEFQVINNHDNVFRDELKLPRRTGHNHLPGL